MQGLSLAVLLAQHNEVVALDTVPEKVELLNNRKSSIQDDYIEKYLAEKELSLKATVDAEEAYKEADYVILYLYNRDNQQNVSIYKGFAA